GPRRRPAAPRGHHAGERVPGPGRQPPPLPAPPAHPPPGDGSTHRGTPSEELLDRPGHPSGVPRTPPAGPLRLTRPPPPAGGVAPGPRGGGGRGTAGAGGGGGGGRGGGSGARARVAAA